MNTEDLTIERIADLIAEVKRLRSDLLRYEPPEGFDWDDEHPRYSIEDWMEVLVYGPSRPGYWEWVNFQINYVRPEENAP